MDLTLISYAAVESVGFLQILKNFLPKTIPTWIFSIFMMILSGLFTFVNMFCPAVVSSIFMTICVSQIGYEAILQTIRKFTEGIFKGAEK